MIVVETIDDANKVLNYLRDHKIGTTKCLALDQVTKVYTEVMNQEFAAPASSKRLFDLIKPNSDEFRVAFYSAVSNTLVVSDIETANDIAYGRQRQRVVTLNGELFEKSGISSGGGKPKRGLMSAQQKRKSIVKDQADLHQLIDQKEKLSRKVDEINAEIQKCQRDIYELNLNEANKEAALFKERYPATKRAIAHRQLKTEEELKVCCQKYEKCLEQREEKEKLLKQLIDNRDQECRKEMEAAQDRIQELKTQIESAGGAEYVEIKSGYEEIKAEYDNQIDILGKVISMKGVGEKEIEKMMIEIQENEAIIVNVSKTKVELEKNLEELEQRCEEILDELEKVKQQGEEIDREWRQENHKLAEVKELMRKFKLEKDQIEQAKDKIESELSEFQNRSNDLSKNISKKFKAVKK